MMSSSEEKLQCYNRTCGQMFDPLNNADDSCTHHPGVPVFHDAYKSWSCCNKKTTDFTEFLNMKGCSTSCHSNVKPAEPEKPKESKEAPPIPQPLEHQVVMERPDVNQPLISLPHTVGSSLKPVLEKMLQEITLVTDEANDGVIKVNTPCQNKGCREVYKGESSNADTCLYHEGVPVFHEGMKYWSCCVKRTTDFNSFLDQVGCSTGKHKWHKDTSLETRAKCRYDWHQTGSTVIVSVFSKCPLPDLSYVEANPVKLHIHITFGKDKEVFDQEMELFGIVEVENCSVTYLGSKVEIKMKKAESVCWKNIAARNIMNINNMSI